MSKVVQVIRGRDCTVTLEPRPHYCDRGRFMAQIWPEGTLEPYDVDIDDADGFPRYYFDEERAKLEMEAFLRARRRFIEGAVWEVLCETEGSIPGVAPAGHADAGGR